MKPTLVTGLGAVDATTLITALSATSQVLVHEDPRTLHASHLRAAGIRNVVYVPGLERWSGMRSEAHALRGLLEACEAALVDQVVVLSSHRVYGASPRHSLFLPESTPYAEDPGDAELCDLIALDRAALAWSSEKQRAKVVVLRPVFVLGGTLGGSLERYLGARFVPQVLGFDPMVQLLHEHDLCRAIGRVLERQGLSGAYNVVGSGSVPISVIARERDVRRVPLLGGLGLKLNELACAAGRSAVRNQALQFLTHVLSVDGSAFARATGFEAVVPLRDMVLGRPYPPTAAECEVPASYTRAAEVDHAASHA